MPYKFPVANFDWLGELPQLAEEARGNAARKEALANLDFSNPDAMEKAASKLFETSNTKNMEMALRLQTAAREKRALGHTISQDTMYQKYLPQLLKTMQGGGGDVEAPPPQAPQSPAAPSPFDTAPRGTVPGMSAAPPPSAPPQGVPPNMAMSPSDELLARAEGAAPPPAPGPQFAQAGGAPQLPGPPPAAAMPPWMQGAQSRPMTMPQGGQGPTQAPVPLPTSGTREAAQQEVRRLEAAILMVPPKAPQLLQPLLTKYRDALKRTEYTAEQQNYLFEQAQRKGMGEPVQTVGQWNAEKQTLKGHLDEVQSIYKEYRTDANTSRKSIEILDRMDQIIKHPSFISGKGAALYGSAVNGLNTLAQIARQYNIPVPDDLGAKYAGVPDPTKVAALQDEYVALSNKVVFATLGTLGNQISEGDRKFIERANASLSGTPEGNKALHKFMRQVAERAGEPEKWAREYRQKFGDRGTAAGMEQYIADKRESHKIFTTSDEKELDAAIGKTTAPPPPKTAPAATRRVQGPDGKFYRFDPATGGMEPE